MATGVVDEQGRGADNRWRDILWLVRRDIRRDWVAYLTSAAYMLLFGALGAPRGEQGLGTWSPEILFPIMVMLLAEPFLSMENFSWGPTDRVAERLTFLRTFPIPLEVIVRSRMLAMLAALVLNVPALFLPFWIIGEWEISRLDYIWFALFWIGISIGVSGYSLRMEMGTSLKRYSLTNLVVLAVMFTVVTVIGVRYDVWMIRGSVGLIERFGPLMSLASLTIGIGIFAMMGGVAIRRLRERELTP